jgi:hypothetical protein
MAAPPLCHGSTSCHASRGAEPWQHRRLAMVALPSCHASRAAEPWQHLHCAMVAPPSCHGSPSSHRSQQPRRFVASTLGRHQVALPHTSSQHQRSGLGAPPHADLQNCCPTAQRSAPGLPSTASQDPGFAEPPPHGSRQHRLHLCRLHLCSCRLRNWGRGDEI